MSPQKHLAETLLGGAIPYLESCPGVSEVKIYSKAPCSTTLLSIWEREKNVNLPNDYRVFCLLTDGLSVTWRCKFQEDFIAGDIHVNSLEYCTQVYEECPHGVAFLIEDVKNYGKICFVFRESKDVEIWFLETETRIWSYLTHSFTSYFRLMVANLGIHGWQMAYTQTGLSQWTHDWLCFYAPDRAELYRLARAQAQYSSIIYTKHTKEQMDSVDPILREAGFATPGVNWWVLDGDEFNIAYSPQKSKHCPSNDVFNVDKVIKACAAFNKDRSGAGTPMNRDRPSSASSVRRAPLKRPVTAPVARR